VSLIFICDFCKKKYKAQYTRVAIIYDGGRVKSEKNPCTDCQNKGVKRAITIRRGNKDIDLLEL